MGTWIGAPHARRHTYNMEVQVYVFRNTIPVPVSISVLVAWERLRGIVGVVYGIAWMV